MTTTLFDEEFQRLNEQLCELKSQNYNIKTSLKKTLEENQALQDENKQLKKQLNESSSQNYQQIKKLNPFAFAKSIANRVDARLHQFHQSSSNDHSINYCNDKLPDKIETLSDSFSDPQRNVLKEEIALLKTKIKHLEMENSESSNFDTSLESCISILKESVRQHMQQKNGTNLSKHSDFISRLLMPKSEVQSILNNSSDEDLINRLLKINDFKMACDELVNYYELKFEQLEYIIIGICSKLNTASENFREFQKELKDSRLKDEKLFKEEDTSHSQILENVHQKYQIEMEPILQELDNLKNKNEELEIRIKLLQNKVIECQEEKKISEKRGSKIIKELRKQLKIERNRADKLQNFLNQEIEVNEDQNKSFQDLAVVQSSSDKCSSTDSWTYMNEPSIILSSTAATSAISPSVIQTKIGHDPEFSDLEICDIENNKPKAVSNEISNREKLPVSSLLPDNTTNTNLEQEYVKLLEKLSTLQKKNCTLEERIHVLERNLTDYKLGGDSLVRQQSLALKNSKPTTAINNSILKMINYIKDKSELMSNSSNIDGSKHQINDAHRKLQRMVEEVLTKNMHLQANLEVMSQDLMMTKRKLQSYEFTSLNNQ